MTAAGFRPTTYDNLQLLSRQTVRVDGAVSLATVIESVNVTATGEAVITTEVSSIAETKTGRELLDLPVAIGSRGLGSTSAISTLTTQAGVQTDNAGRDFGRGLEAQHAIGDDRRHQHHGRPEQCGDRGAVFHPSGRSGRSG